ncbi:MAG TPA: hypothetical protein DDY20_01895 [Desulfobulbaceae bacterium]|nr:hypothetical protein [Desulfobulbaceae bacterium]
MLQPFFIIPRIGRVAYLNNPKAACSSVLVALSQMRLGRNFQPPQELLPDGSHPIHGFHPDEHAHLVYFFGRWPLNLPPLSADLVRFTFVRNPYARFYSFYKSKILAGQAPGQYYERFGIRQGCSFDECVRIISSLDPRELEHHAAPQSMLMSDGKALHVDFVGKVEEFSRDWQVVNDLTGCNFHLDHLNRTDSAGNSVYSARNKELVYSYFRDDFLLFGYEKDSVLAAAGGGREEFDELSYAGHHLSSAAIDRIRQQLLLSNERIRILASEFAENSIKRDEFFGSGEEVFRELLLKRVAAVDKKTDEYYREQSLSLQKSVSIISSKIDNILKFNKRCGEKFSEIKEEINRLSKREEEILRRVDREREAFQKQLSRERDEIGRTKKLLYEHALSAFKQARQNRWKRLCCLLSSPRLREARFLRESGLVDPHYYFENYPGAMKFGLTAAEHYVRLGAQQGYNPSAHFNTRKYLAEHPDVTHTGINPLVHHLLHRQDR